MEGRKTSAEEQSNRKNTSAMLALLASYSRSSFLGMAARRPQRRSKQSEKRKCVAFNIVMQP
ncbi:hypothetical protein J40TS1_43720 [Paenibacillus montaniterrae]|uniref:Uncharacterized protein n=1 Tax=Paenibacillus montaniterrae TaxID=429341 RepID=A0A919YSN5_9BACL|nr:hypothetical protein J40TS1_43720 [Paenibacillus montaniterrae]